MFKKMLALMLAAVILILPLQALAITEQEWNEGCRFWTTVDVTLYTRDQETLQFKPFEAALNPVLPAHSCISPVSTEVEGMRQISFFRDGSAQYAWIEAKINGAPTFELYVETVEVDGTKINLPKLAWGNEEAIRKYMRSFYSEEQIQKVLTIMSSSVPAQQAAAVTAVPQAAPQATPQPVAAPEVTAAPANVAETVQEPVPQQAAAVTAAPAAPAPVAQSSGLIPAGAAPTPYPETSFLTVSYYQNGAFQGTAQLVRLGAVSSLIAIGGTAYKIDTDDLEWETNAEQGTRLAAVSNIEMSSAFLRAKGDLSGERLCNVPAGAVVPVLDNVNGENYTRIYYAGRIGYISNGLLVYSDGEDPIAHGVLSFDGTTLGNKEVVVWVHPNTASFIVGRWATGTVVDVLEYNDDWIRVEVDGFQGWVNSKYINLQ